MMYTTFCIQCMLLTYDIEFRSCTRMRHLLVLAFEMQTNISKQIKPYFFESSVDMNKVGIWYCHVFVGLLTHIFQAYK